MQGQQQGGNVSVGPTTVAGWGVSATAFALAVLAFTSGDRSQATLGTIVCGVIGGLAFAVTQFGRMQQAKEMAKPAPLIVVGNGTAESPLQAVQVAQTPTQAPEPPSDVPPAPQAPSFVGWTKDVAPPPPGSRPTGGPPTPRAITAQDLVAGSAALGSAAIAAGEWAGIPPEVDDSAHELSEGEIDAPTGPTLGEV